MYQIDVRFWVGLQRLCELKLRETKGAAGEGWQLSYELHASYLQRFWNIEPFLVRNAFLSFGDNDHLSVGPVVIHGLVGLLELVERPHRPSANFQFAAFD